MKPIGVRFEPDMLAAIDARSLPREGRGDTIRRLLRVALDVPHRWVVAVGLSELPVEVLRDEINRRAAGAAGEAG